MKGDAIILIPGIKGNQLIDTNTHNFHPIWRDMRFNFQRVQDLEFTAEYDEQFYEEKIDTIVTNGPVESLAYKEFMEDIDSDLPKFYFSYDWRKSNRDNAKLLDDFIKMLINKSKASHNASTINKVNIVTHSMGNHICRFYINDFGFKSIHKVVFVAPPFLGSIAMVDAVIRGQGLFKNVKKKLRQIVRTFPGAVELFPTYEYAAVFNNGQAVDFYNKDHWQAGIMRALQDTKETYEKRLAEKFVLNIEKAKKDMSDLENWMKDLSVEDRKRLLIIVRDEFKTDQAVKVNEEDPVTKNSIDFREALVTEDGDGVVTHASSCCYHDSILTLAIEDSWRFDDDSHAFFMTEERVQQLVSWYFNDKETFDYHIPGNSIKRVTGLKKKTKKSLNYWKITKE
ncbi:MAG: hypothetical protein DRJ05_16870 [Bacteroidetes bacterium]|nr:MAG: hypothetical protein DRJ05_16870 [Bacteroidota bacterium]